MSAESPDSPFDQQQKWDTNHSLLYLCNFRISETKTCVYTMDPAIVEGLLKAIRDAVSDRHRGDDVAFPPFDPAKNENGAESWCNSINSIAVDLGWSSVTTVAKAGNALKGSALLWYETWDPEEGRTWEAFRTTIRDLYPEKRNLSDKLTKAVLLNSDTADSYCEYAREKLRLLKNTKVAFTEHQLVELVCGGVADVNVKMASYNSNAKTTAELISLFTTYVKNQKKRPLDTDNKSSNDHDFTKRSKIEGPQEKRCYLCHKPGHNRFQCFSNPNKLIEKRFPDTRTPGPSNMARTLQCTYCKKLGHTEATCFFKKRGPAANSPPITKNNDVNCFTKSGLKLTKVLIKDLTVDALIDTGASCSIIKDSLAKQLGCKLDPCALTLEGIGDRNTDQYLMINDLLHYKTNSNATPKLYVPKGYRLSILRLFHDDNCHVGYDKTLNKIQEHFWFPGITAFTKKYISHCLIYRGTNFTSNQVQSMFREMQIEHHMISTGTPRSNGQVERYVATITNMLTTTINRELAQQRLKDVADKFKERFDTTRRTNKTYNTGDVVFISQDHRRHDKLSPKFKGPYEIIAEAPNERFCLRGQNNLRNITVAKEKLRVWPGEWIEQNVSFEGI
ncbi:Transposon Ty3-I Gag-Pol polyprotein [Operophtera brumata]|uniref:RNA-directed DNA polymerase n=1 Tax=Operophtera brumata TaxID=104452 RepID=A0A0L7LE80_OPEBR|nr:Transposon Ty3-I Gag-Pol polyprotein [Operophtera brumata]